MRGTYLSVLAAALPSASLTAQGDGLFELALTPPLLQPNMSHHPPLHSSRCLPDSYYKFALRHSCLNVQLVDANVSKQPCRKVDATDPPPKHLKRYGHTKPSLCAVGPVPTLDIAPHPPGPLLDKDKQHRSLQDQAHSSVSKEVPSL